MKKREIFQIVENRRIADKVFELELAGDTEAFSAPGQFAEIAVSGFFLRRPISVCDLWEGRLTLVYKVVGGGTEKMSRLEKGEKIDLLIGLGNGFDVGKCGKCALVAGGGAGVPPLLLLTKKLIEAGKSVKAVLGFNSCADVILADRLAAAGADVRVVTTDGSAGQKGLVTDFLPEESTYDYFYACGPKAMLKALCEKTAVSGEVSLEERMGCGFGACMGCAVRTNGGLKRVCADGPVFPKEALIW